MKYALNSIKCFILNIPYYFAYKLKLKTIFNLNYIPTYNISWKEQERQELEEAEEWGYDSVIECAIDIAKNIEETLPNGENTLIPGYALMYNEDIIRAMELRNKRMAIKRDIEMFIRLRRKNETN